mgnify:CR=1 FL=1
MEGSFTKGSFAKGSFNQDSSFGRDGSSSAAHGGGPTTRRPHDLYCWGYGGQGAVGNRAFRDELAPYLVSRLPPE